MRVVGHGLRDELFVGGLPYAGPIGRTQRHGCQKRARMCGLGSKGWRILPPGRAKDPGANEGVEVREVVVPTVGLPAEAGKAGAPHGTFTTLVGSQFRIFGGSQNGGRVCAHIYSTYMP